MVKDEKALVMEMGINRYVNDMGKKCFIKSLTVPSRGMNNI